MARNVLLDTLNFAGEDQGSEGHAFAFNGQNRGVIVGGWYRWRSGQIKGRVEHLRAKFDSVTVKQWSSETVVCGNRHVTFALEMSGSGSVDRERGL